MEAPPEPNVWFTMLVNIFGPGGAVLAVTNAASLWWIKRREEKHEEERKNLLAQIKDSEDKRRADGISQFAKIDTFIDKLTTAYEGVTKTLVNLRIAFASKGVQSDV